MAAVNRCFVGLWPDPTAAAQLDALAATLSAEFPPARRVPRDRLHLTLAFIGDLEPTVAARLAARVHGVPTEPFEWHLTEVGRFDRARVAWAGGCTAPALAHLAAAVHGLLDREGVAYDRRPYRPHVTLLRSLPRQSAGLERALVPPIAWMASAPRLLCSSGGRYVEVGTNQARAR